jgi:hypothetical protein
MREGEASCQVIPEVPHSFHLIQRSLISFVGYRHRFGADPDPDSAFDFPLQIRIRILPQVILKFTNLVFILLFIHGNACLNLFKSFLSFSPVL